MADNAAGTYRTLRSMMVLLLSLLAGSIGLHMLVNELCVQHSISGYYYTSAQAMFVGMMCAIGASLIIYQGNGVENALLDFSGVMAFIVAFVPADKDETCEVTRVPGLETSPDWSTTLPPVLIAGAGAITWLLLKWKEEEGRSAFVLRWVTLLLVVGLGCWAGFGADSFARHGHLVAAGLLFAGIIGVVCTSGRNYRWLAAIMLGSVGLWLLVLWLWPFPHLMLVVEAALIVEFLLFWSLETWRLRNTT